MPPPVDVGISDEEQNAFVVAWMYPEEDVVVPTDFDIVVGADVYETVEYLGTEQHYSWYVGEQPCGATLEVQIVAVNGDARAQSETVEAETLAC